MLYTYCKSCGSKNLYSLHPPKFCSSCGVAMGSGATTTKKAEKPSEKRRPGRQEEDSDGLDIQFVPDVKNFKCSTSNTGIGARVMKIDQFLPEPQQEVEEKQQKKKRGRPRKRK